MNNQPPATRFLTILCSLLAQPGYTYKRESDEPKESDAPLKTYLVLRDSPDNAAVVARDESEETGGTLALMKIK